MNLKKFIVPLLAAGVFFVASCDNGNEQTEEVNISVSQSEITVDSLTTEATVELTSNMPWVAEVAETDTWVSVEPMSGDKAEALKITLTMTQNLAAEGAVAQDRTANITFRVDAEHFATVKLTQKRGEPAENEEPGPDDPEPTPDPEPGETKDNPIAANMGEFKKGTDSLWYQLTGEIYGINDSENGQFDLKDVTGKVEVYYMTKADGDEIGNFHELGLKEGDIVTLIGLKDADGTVVNSWYVDHFRPVKATLAEVVAAAPAADVWYKVSGAISEIVNEEIGEVKLVDGESAITVVGVTMTIESENDHSFAYLGLKVTDTLTLIGTRGANGIEGPAFYHSHTEYVEPVEPDPGQPAGPENSKDVTVEEFLATSTSDDVWYNITGEITYIKKPSVLYTAQITVKDETGEVYVHKLVSAYGNTYSTDDFNSMNLAVGDIVKVCGTNGGSQRLDDAFLVEIVEKAPEEDVEPINETLTFSNALKTTDDDGTVSYTFYFNNEDVVIDITPTNPDSFIGTFTLRGEEADGSINGAYSTYNKYGFMDGAKCVISQDGETYTLTLEGKWKKNEAPITLKYTGPITFGTVDEGDGDGEATPL